MKNKKRGVVILCWWIRVYIEEGEEEEDGFVWEYGKYLTFF